LCKKLYKSFLFKLNHKIQSGLRFLTFILFHPLTIKICKMKNVLPGKIGLITILLISLAACHKDWSPVKPRCSTDFKGNPTDPKGIIFYALAGNTLDKYSTACPETVLSSAKITGLQTGEKILGIDFRPITGQLYALGSNSRVYIVDPGNGVATLAFSFTSSATGMPVMLSGTSFGFDFNPQVDRLRIVGNTGQNLRVVPDNAATGVAGTTFIDGSINPQPASVNGVAYTNNFAGTATTELFALETSTDQLYKINPPNAGTLVEPNSVKHSLEGDGGFDVAPRNANVTTDIGLALYGVNNKSTLMRIEAGEIKILATYKKDIMYTALAISPAM
jgi:hypothetical protein